MTFFVTDLDKTLIFSKKFIKNEDVETIEYKDNQELSYMTKTALNTLKAINEKITIIPITSRSFEQYKRINLNMKFKYTILSNGGTILCNDIIDNEWKEIIKKEFSKMNLTNVEALLHNSSSLFENYYELRDNSYYYARIKENQEFVVLKLLKPFLGKDWNCFIQDNKLYVMPKIVSKENALKYLIKKYNLDLSNSFGAGDGRQDEKFLSLVPNKISFKDSELWDSLSVSDKYNYSVWPLGLLGSENMLKTIKGLI